MKLFSNRADQVSSFSHLETELIDPTRKMHIFSGIAIPNFDIDDDGSIHRTSCEVDLGIAIPDIQQSAAQVGLASIVNDESAFVFAVDNARIEPQHDTGQLLLVVDLAVKGDDSSVKRFGFQAVVVSGVRATGITGRITWHRSVFNAPNLSSNQIVTLAGIDANTIQHIDAPLGGFPGERLVPIASTVPQSLHRDGDDFWVPYAFDHLPLNTPLRVTVGRLATVFPPGANAGQVHGPLTITLTPGHLSEAGVDFRITAGGLK